MPSLWSYPWTLAEEGLDEACRTFDDIGVDTVNVTSHYHSVRSMQPRFPESLFVQYPGGCYFTPDPDRFEATPIDPIQNTIAPFDDPLAEIVEHLKSRDIDVNGWVVLGHNSRLGSTHPEFRLESAFGDPQDHAFCPSHPAVQEYFAAVVGATAARGVDEIHLESLGFQSVLHDHGAEFGHDKRQIQLSSSEEVLLSQCFCEACQAAAAPHPVRFDEARSVVRDRLLQTFDEARSTLPDLDGLVAEHSVLRELFEFRADTITQLLARLAEAAGDTPLNYYVMDGRGLDAADVWPSGVQFGDLQEHLDRVTALCYVRDPEKARLRVRGIETVVDCEVDVGLTFDPQVIRSPAELGSLVDAVRSSPERRLHMYHYTLMTDDHLEWVKQVL